jgi:hypothetical protein
MSPFARRIERAIAARADRPAVSCVTIGDRAGRVLVMVRSDGARTRVIAVCPPALRDEVERALAHARFALGAAAVCVEAA